MNNNVIIILFNFNIFSFNICIYNFFKKYEFKRYLISIFVNIIK